MAPLNKDGYNKSVWDVRCAYGITPLDRTVLAGGEDLKPFPGKSAMIIVSDFEHLKNVDDLNPETALANVAKLKREFGDNLCVYAVQVGAAKGGKELAEAMAKASGCGFAVNATELATPQGMASFVERGFLEPASVAAEQKKAAASAPAAVAPTREGAVKAPAAARPAAASTLENIYFDFDKSNIRPSDRDILKVHAAWLMNNKDYKVLIAGHCDERGTTEYNLARGERRAAAAKKCLVSLGVDESRINTISFARNGP
jgi:peptidoglycan-associated lipoprotein